MINLPAEIIGASARLPQAYENAKSALAECSRVDECQAWANKAAAMASYARQSDDKTLFNFARRIQARAVRRCGELLKQFDGQGSRTDQLSEGNHTKLTQQKAAEDAGLSKHQQIQAIRVANVPAEQFEAIESDSPPTVTALAEAGTAYREPPPPEGFAEATKLLGSVRRFAAFCEDNDPKHVAHGVMQTESPELRDMVASIDGWLDQFVTSLKDGKR